MKQKIKIPKKIDVTRGWLFTAIVASAYPFIMFFGLIDMPMNNLGGISGTKGQIILMVCCFAIIALCLIIALYRSNRYYSPQYRALVVTGLQQLLDCTAGQCFVVYKFNIHDRRHFVLQLVNYDEDEKYFIDIRFNTQKASELRDHIVSLREKNGKTILLSFVANYSKNEFGPDGAQSVSMDFWVKDGSVSSLYLGPINSNNLFDTYLTE